uniref:Uncharacterized protein n=1 Tax=Panagrolaimus sp. ES5 TaxID=591445 RepID=A0AC34FRK3_9BILA
MFFCQDSYAPENGAVGIERSPLLHEKYGACCANSKVVRMIFRPDRNDIKMDTRETITIAPQELAAFLEEGDAAHDLVLVFATSKKMLYLLMVTFGQPSLEILSG